MQLRRYFTTRKVFLFVFFIYVFLKGICRSSYDIQLILGERKEVRLDSKELAVNKVDGGESKIATKKKVF